MRAHRGKQIDWNKPFKTIINKSDFDKLETNDNELLVPLTSKVETNPPPIVKKQQIIVPKIDIVRRITEPKKFARVDANYIRLTEELNLPKLMSYQLNQVDHVFLQGQSSKFRHNGKSVITPEFLSTAFIQLEIKAGKDHVLPRVKTWMTNFIERQHKQLLNMPNVDQLAQVFYNYWKNRRQQLKFPMLRPLWRPNPEQYSHLLAFKPRQKDKRSLRRTSRIAEDEIVQQLEQEFSLGLNIVERLKMREQLKLKQLQLNFTNFHNECRQILPNTMIDTSFYTPFEPQSRIKDKQKMKSFQQQVDYIKREQIEQQRQQQQNQIIAQQTYDQKKSIVNFLSTLVFYAESYGISYEKIFHDRVGIPQRELSIPRINQPVARIEEPDQTIVLPDPVQKPQCLQLSLYKDKDTIFRVLEEQQSQINSESENQSNNVHSDDKLKMKTPSSLMQYYMMNLKCYSFGEEDDGDTRDLRRITSQNFKRFQNLMRS